MNKAALKKTVKLANANFAKRSRFTVAEFQQIADHVVNSDFIERLFLKNLVPALTLSDMEKLEDNQLALQTEMVQSSSLLHKVLGGFEGTGIDVSSYVVAMWGPERLARL